MIERGVMYSTKELEIDGLKHRLKSKYKHMVILLDTVDAKESYSVLHAKDSLNNLGWVKFDDVAAVIGKTKTKEIIKYCEEKLRKEAHNKSTEDK